MGLASKLQAAQAAANVLAPHLMGPGHGASPSAPPYPAAPGGYPAGGPYMVPAQPQHAGAAYPSPYAPAPAAFGAAAPRPVGVMAPPGGPYPAPAASPYPNTMATAPAMAAPHPGMMQQLHFGGGAGAQAAPLSGASSGMQASILAKLQSIAATNQLQRFYPPQALHALAARLDGRVNLRDLAARWGMPVELALDLAALALYDVVLVADDSGSIAFEENGERIEDLKLIAQKVSEVATLFDDDGILVRFMNSPVEGNAVRSPADVGALLAQVQYAGLTPLAASLQSRVLQPIVFSLAASGQLAKPVLVITITDGEPTDNPKDLVVQVIKDARNRLAAQYGPMAVAFEFCQVGKDQRAQAFLAQLDAHPQVGSSIDCTSYFELESAEYMKRGINLSPAMWLVKMMIGAIDISHDQGDEHH